MPPKIKTKMKRLTCIVCPLSCILDAEYTPNRIKSISGQKCKKGRIYAEEELFAPKRILTTTVKVDGGMLPLVSVKTDKPVPKEKLFSILDETIQLTLEAPVKLGDIIIKNVQNTKINIVATKTVERI